MKASLSIDATNNADDIDQVKLHDLIFKISSPSDNALDFQKRKRFNQMKAKEEKDKAKAEAGLSIGECDIGASPQMTKSSLVPPKVKKATGKMESPLQKARELNFK